MSKVIYKDKFDSYEYAVIDEDGVYFHRYSTKIDGEIYDYCGEMYKEFIREGVFISSGVRRSDALRYAEAAFGRRRKQLRISNG